MNSLRCYSLTVSIWYCWTLPVVAERQNYTFLPACQLVLQPWVWALASSTTSLHLVLGFWTKLFFYRMRFLAPCQNYTKVPVICFIADSCECCSTSPGNLIVRHLWSIDFHLISTSFIFLHKNDWFIFLLLYYRQLGTWFVHCFVMWLEVLVVSFVASGTASPLSFRHLLLMPEWVWLPFFRKGKYVWCYLWILLTVAIKIIRSTSLDIINYPASQGGWDGHGM
jgi:hypothetical protein